MRWLTFAILAALTLCVQTTLTERTTFMGMRADFAIVLLTHYALQTRSGDGPIAGWLLGLFMGLSSAQPAGLVALAYGLAAVAVWSIRSLVFLRHPLTHFIITAATCGITHSTLWLYSSTVAGSAVGWRDIFYTCFFDGLYTGAWAVIVHGVLLRASRLLGLTQRPLPDFSGAHRLV
jgi:rod shape-determining protein MreD